MSTTAAAWVVLSGILFLLSFRRGVYAVGLYMLTFFAAPPLWWWGRDLPSARSALIAGLMLLGATLLHLVRSPENGGHRFGMVHIMALGMAINATFVQVAITSSPTISLNNYVELVKLVLLTFLIWRVIQDKADLRI